MDAEESLGELLASLDPVLASTRYVFCSLDAVPADLDTRATVVEDEGTTIVIEESVARVRGYEFDEVFSLITLGVRSELSAVGLTAAVSGALFKAGIACNVIAGYFHDHLLVPAERASEAVGVLERLAASVGRSG